jgi:hypothetical protein
MASQPHAQLLLLITIARAAALAVLATEALFLWTRRGDPDAPRGGRPLARLVWVATPAVVLVGLSLWCAAELKSQTFPTPPGAVALGEAVP